MTIENVMDVASMFAALNITGNGYSRRTQLNDVEWSVNDYAGSIRLNREVPGGRAEIWGVSKGKFGLSITLNGVVRVRLTRIEYFADISSAAAAADEFVWKTIEHAGQVWYEVGDRHWIAVLGEGHEAEIVQHGKGDDFSMSLKICPAYGESYELKAIRYDADQSRAVRTFEEAAAIVLTLPTYIATLMAKPIGM